MSIYRYRKFRVPERLKATEDISTTATSANDIDDIKRLEEEIMKISSLLYSVKTHSPSEGTV